MNYTKMINIDVCIYFMPPITADQLYTIYCQGLLLWNLQKQKESIVLYKNIEPDIIILLSCK